MTDTIAERAQAIVEEFELFDDWMGRYEYLIDLARSMPLIEDTFKTEAYRIHGCQSQVWLRAEAADGRIRFRADSDALITRGLVALLIRVLDDQPAEAIFRADLAFLDRLGMQEHLSPTRKNGLAAMVRQMKHYALALSTPALPPAAG